MSSPCAQTCTPKSTRSGFTSGSGTWRLEWPTASLSSTWWRAAACILRAWNHSSILRGRPWRKVSDGSAPAPTSNTFATAIRWVNWKCQFTEFYCPISYFSSSFHGHYNSNYNPRSRISLKKTFFLHLEHKGRQQWHNHPVLAHLDSPVPSRLRHLLPGPLLPLHLFTPAVLPEAHYLRPSSGVILYTAGAVPQPGWERRVRGDSDVPRGRQGGGPDQEGCGGDGQSPPRRDQQLLDDGGVPRLPARGLGGCSATQGHFCFQGERTDACRLTSVIFPRSLCQNILIRLVYFSHMDLWCCRWCRCWILMVWSWVITAALWQAGTSTDITRHCSEIRFRVCGILATWWKGKKSKYVLYVKELVLCGFLQFSVFSSLSVLS